MGNNRKGGVLTKPLEAMTIGVIILWSMFFVLISPLFLVAQGAPTSSWIGYCIVSGCILYTWGDTIKMLKEGRL
jgi:membrane protein implicated in regulation of membrane protease activity